MNALYAWLVRRPATAFGRALTRVDDRVIDGAVNEVGQEVGRASRLAPVLQRGFVRSYALAFLLGRRGAPPLSGGPRVTGQGTYRGAGRG